MAIDHSWVDIAATQVDANSPLVDTLFEAIRNCLYHLEDWLGKDYTAANNHDHNGTNSKAVSYANLSNKTAAIVQGELKTSTTEITKVDSSGWQNVSGSSYMFWPEVKCDATGGGGIGTADIWVVDALPQTEDSYYTRCYININLTTTEVTAYAKFRYIQSSPPYSFLGEEDYGLFLYVLRRTSDGYPLAAQSTFDPLHECVRGLPKGHPAGFVIGPHPFGDVPEGTEVVLVDLRHMNEVVDVPDDDKEGLSLIRRMRADLIDRGMTEEELDTWESLQPSLNKVEKARKIDILIRRQDSQGKCLLDLIHQPSVDGELETEFRASVLEADKEVKGKDRDTLPTILVGQSRTPWRDLVHVVRNTRRAV